MAFSPYIGEHLEAFRFLDQKHGAFGLPRTDRDLTVNHDPLVRALNRNLCHPMRQKCSKALMDTKSVNRFEEGHLVGDDLDAVPLDILVVGPAGVVERTWIVRR